ncbi:MAG TPA: IclR family transcriptional regulator [Micromonosporaceae bacterium]|jgi:DNA-binding IclR family transcriptional regulator
MRAVRECTRSAAENAPANRAVVDKAFTLLEAWNHRGETLGSSELARRTGLPKSTSHRLLGILESAGLIERLGTGYQLGGRLHGFSGVLAADYPPDLREVTLPFLQDLYELTHETVHLAVLDGTDVYCVEKVYGHRRNPVRSRVDGFLPVHSTALGKVLLAYSPGPTQRRVLTTVAEPVRLAGELRTILRCGVGYDRAETHPAVTCVAAPVLDPRGQIVAAISISGRIDRFDPVFVTEPLRRTARAASSALASARRVPAAA